LKQVERTAVNFDKDHFAQPFVRLGSAPALRVINGRTALMSTHYRSSSVVLFDALVQDFLTGCQITAFSSGMKEAEIARHATHKIAW
jgi:hypothetical protein